MRIHNTFFFFAASGILAFGQIASVEGVVTNSLTGAPLPRVNVVLQDPDESTATRYGALTMPDGKFSVSGLKPGTYSVTGERIGFVTPIGFDARVTVKADDEKNDFQLKLVPVGAITGRITDAEGKPVEGAGVRVDAPSAGRESTTDEQGQFRIGGLAPGKYRVTAAHESFMFGSHSRPEIRTDGTADLRNATTYYPGVLAPKEAKHVEVRAGGETPGVDIQLVGVPFVRVSVKALGMPRAPEQAFVSVGSSAMRGGFGTPLNPDGSFEIWGLDPGEYTVSAGWTAAGGRESKFGPWVNTTSIEIVVADANIDNLELHVVPDSDSAGRLELDAQPGTLPAAMRTITLSQIGNRSTSELRAQVDPDGTFKLEKIPAAKYVVVLSWETAYVKSMRLGTVAIDGAALDLSDGSGGGDLALLLSPATGVVSGTVRDDRGNPAAGRVVMIADDEKAGFAPRYAKAGKDGAYSFWNLPPGNYKLLAVPPNGPALKWESEIMGYQDAMESIEVHEGDKVSTDLKRWPERAK
jgi:protocatechuate 3,4-dioxygenase beta subunit